MAKESKSICILILCIFIVRQGFTQKNFNRYFDACGVTGSTTVYDYRHQKWIYTDSLDAQVATLPASTFKILNALIALETGAIIDEHEIVKWDGIDRQFSGKSIEAWNRDNNLKDAYKNSTVWFYVRIAERIGRKKYKKIFKKIHYGNQDLSESGTDFWNYGPFGISPKQQVDFLIRLYEDRLPFSVRNIGIVKDIMVSEQDGIGIFRDKTGWTVKDGKNIGWWIGYVTTQANVYFFATRIMSNADVANSNFSTCRKTITKQVLKEIVK